MLKSDLPTHPEHVNQANLLNLPPDSVKARRQLQSTVNQNRNMSKKTESPAPYCFLYRNKPPEFIIKSNYKLSDKELYRIARAIIKQRKDNLFMVWKFKNPSWKGNASLKKAALLRDSPLPHPVILEAYDPIVVSKGILRSKS
jgi:hypothetical protein